jgi:hypothetical protein
MVAPALSCFVKCWRNAVYRPLKCRPHHNEAHEKRNRGPPTAPFLLRMTMCDCKT